MNTGAVLSTQIVNALAAAMAGATLTLYSGTQPASPETALSGNTALCTFTVTEFSGAGLPVNLGLGLPLGATFADSTEAISASGVVTFARLTAAPWATSTAYALGQLITASNGFILECTTAGTSASSGSGPSITTGTATDGSVTWTSQQSKGALADLTVGSAGSVDITVPSTTLTAGSGNTVTISLILYIPAT